MASSSCMPLSKALNPEIQYSTSYGDASMFHCSVTGNPHSQQMSQVNFPDDKDRSKFLRAKEPSGVRHLLPRTMLFDETKMRRAKDAFPQNGGLLSESGMNPFLFSKKGIEGHPLRSLSSTNGGGKGMDKTVWENRSVRQPSARGGRWLPDEHERFLEGIAAHGHKWKLVQRIVRTRTVTQVRTHAQKYLLKLKKESSKIVHPEETEATLAAAGDVNKTRKRKYEEMANTDNMAKLIRENELPVATPQESYSSNKPNGPHPVKKKVSSLSPPNVYKVEGKPMEPTLPKIIASKRVGRSAEERGGLDMESGRIKEAALALCALLSSPPVHGVKLMG